MNTNMCDFCQKVMAIIDNFECESITFDTFDFLSKKYADDDQLLYVLRSYRNDKASLVSLWGNLRDVKSAIEFLECD